MPREIPALGAPVHEVWLYLGRMITQGRERGIGSQGVLTACAAIGFFHRQAGLVSPTDDPMCRSLEAAPRVMTARRSKREPIPASALKLTLEYHLGRGPNLGQLMRLTALLLMFTGLLRCKDATAILVHGDLMRFVHTADGALDGVLMFICHSKRDQEGEGRWVAIGATGRQLCPVGMLQRLLREGRYVQDPPPGQDAGPLLRAVAPGSQQLKRVTASLSSPIPALAPGPLGQDLHQLTVDAGAGGHFTSHSMRAGGSTMAALAGADRAQVQTHGRWKHQNAMQDRYIKEVEADAHRFFDLTRSFWPY